MRQKGSKYHLFAVLFGCILSFSSWSQPTEMGSLEQRLNRHIGQDSTKVQLLLELAELNSMKDFDKMEAQALWAQSLSDSIGYVKGKVIALRLLAHRYYLKSDHLTALLFAQQALDMSMPLHMPKERIKILTRIAICYVMIGDYYAALKIYQKALRKCEQINFKAGSIKLLSSIGVVYYYLEEYDTALDYSYKSLDLAQQTNDKHNECRLLGNISEMFREQGQYTKALHTVNKALSLARRLDIEFYLGQNLINAGHTHTNLGNYKKAEAHYEEGIALAKKLDNRWTLSEGLTGLAALKLKRNKLDKAMELADMALQLASSNTHIQSKVEAYGILAKITSAKGNHEKAYTYLKEYKRLSDSILNSDGIQKATALENKFTYERKKDLLKEQQKRTALLQEIEIKRQNQWRKVMVVATVILLLLSAFFLKSLIQRRSSNRLLLVQNKEIEAQNGTLIELDRFKKAMMGTIVDELKPPLTTIINLESNDNHSIPDNTRIIGKQMLNMVLNILDVYKQEQTRLIPIKSDHQLLAIVNDAICEVSLIANNKCLAIINNIRPNLWVSCERELIQRVFATLLANAIKASPMDNQIVIGAKLLSSKIIEVKINDQGALIEEGLVNNIFEKYVQGVARKLGNIRYAGFGLSFCKIAIEAHGGSIMAKSKKGVGTTFSFTLDALQGYGILNLDRDKVPLPFKKIAFDEEDKKVLRPYVEALKKVSVYEISRVKEIIGELNVDQNSIIEWKKDLEKSVLQLDEQNYSKLIQIDEKPTDPVCHTVSDMPQH